MIYEYAIDPEFLIDLADKSDLCLLLRLYFGWGNPCVISGHPAGLLKEVNGIIKKNIENANSDKQIASLQKKKSKVTELGNIFIQNHTKRYNAAAWSGDFGPEHARHPFHGILASRNFSCNCPHINIDKLRDEITCSIYHHEKGLHVKRQPDKLCDAIKPILQNSSQITFIDPYFFPAESRYYDAYKRYLSVVGSVNHIRSESSRNIYIICSGKKEGKNYSPPQEFKQICIDYLNDIVPSGLKLIVYRVKDRQQELHNRYILTDIGGISFGHGTDCSRDIQDSEDDIFLLDKGPLTHWKRVYRPNSQYFDWSEPPVIIQCP